MARLTYLLACRVLAGSFLAGAIAPSARALSFNFTQIAGDTLTSTEAAAFNTAAAAWSAVLADPITVDVQIGFRALGAGVLGQTSPTSVYGSTSQILAALTADAKTAADMMALASLKALPPSGTTIAVTNAEAKALGFAQAGSDGTIEFSTNFPFSDSRNADGTINAGTYDLVGVAEHEIAHLLGFDSSIDAGTGSPQTLLDLFRFNAVNSRATTAGAAFFSLNNGSSAVLDGNGANAAFSTGSGDQASHWLRGVAGLLIPAYSTNQVINITPLDVTALDVIGYDATVPEPYSVAIMLVGLMGVAVARRRA